MWKLFIKNRVLMFQVLMVKPCTGGLSQKMAIIVISSIATIILLVGFIFMRQYEKKWKIDFILKVTSLQEFSYCDIRSATKNFGTGQKLGQGGFGKVYKVHRSVHSSEL